MKKRVKWTKKAKSNLDYYCDEIAKEAPLNAKKVKKKILATAREVSNFPNMYQIEDYYENNQGDIRRFFCWSYRIIYQVREKEIVVLRVVHTSLHPNKITQYT